MNFYTQQHKHYDQLLGEVELYLTRSAKTDDVQTFARLQSVPGIGQILALVILYEIHDIQRFPRVQDFVSYCRLVKCAKESNGKRIGTSGKKIGHGHLRWAFAEAAILFLRHKQPGKDYFAKLKHKHGKAKALTVLAHKLARAVYYMLSREHAFDLNRFVTAYPLRGEPEPGVMKIGDIGTIVLMHNGEFLFLWPGFSDRREHEKRPSGQEQK